MKDREFDIEDAYQIFVLFMQHFWWNHLRHIMREKGLINNGLTPEEFQQASPEEQSKSCVFNAHDFVFSNIPGDPCGCGDYFEKMIERTLNIKNARSLASLSIKERDLMQMIIDFCVYYNNRFEGPPNDYPRNSLSFAIKWLEDMRDSPERHQKEWGMWDEYINDVIIDKYKSAANFRDCEDCC